nr:unnamed protein product [Digitaria exilis]
MSSSQAKEKGSTTQIAPSSEAVASEEIHDTTDDLVSKLPRREGWSEPLVLYNNYWLRPHFAATIMRLQNSNSFKPRHDDIILATNPKCGTTWMKALAFTMSNRSRYEFGNHPLFFRHPQEVVPGIEITLDGGLADFDKLPSPRLLATHMPLSLFPKSIATSGCRVVYMCREPKDACVSRWHFENKMMCSRGHNHIDLESAFSMFSQGFSPYGPFWDHCLEYWKESIASPGNSSKVLFLKYEDMISDPVEHVTRLATFLGVPFSTEEEEDGVPQEVVRLCSFEKLSSLHAVQSGDFGRRGDIVLDKSVFFRKGKVGDWVNHMSEEMGRELDCIVQEKLKGSGLVL